MKTLITNSLVLIIIYLITNPTGINGYVPPDIKQKWKDAGFSKSLEDARKTVEECAYTRKCSKDLFWATKFLDRFASKVYSTPEEKEALLEKANGSWELRLALNSDRDQDFYPHPEFRKFAMAFITIDNEYFGKGIAPDTSFSLVALGGPSTRNIKTRQVYMNYEEFFINGGQVPGWDLSYFMRGYARNWVAAERKRPPLAFTAVCATDKILLLRGNKTGGMALFTRIDGDMRPAAYGTIGI